MDKIFVIHFKVITCISAFFLFSCMYSYVHLGGHLSLKLWIVLSIYTVLSILYNCVTLSVTEVKLEWKIKKKTNLQIESLEVFVKFTYKKWKLMHIKEIYI